MLILVVSVVSVHFLHPVCFVSLTFLQLWNLKKKKKSLNQCSVSQFSPFKMMFAKKLFLVNGKHVLLISLGLFVQSVVGKRLFQKVTKCVPLSQSTVGKSCCLQSVLSKQTSQPWFAYTARSGQEILIKSMIITNRAQPGLLDSGRAFPQLQRKNLEKAAEPEQHWSCGPISQGPVGAELIITKPLLLS